MAESIEVEGLKEFQRAVRRSTDSELPKRLGQANKRVGELVISRLTPRPDPNVVGAGAGSTVRPSASKRDVLLRVGGKHRAKPPLSLWGKRRLSPIGKRLGPRPYIKQTAERHYDEIAEAYLDGIVAAMNGAFADTSK